MISGTGIDIIEVERIAARVGRDSGFKEMVFSAHEIAYCESMANKFEHFAARFAAKEAFLKALGTGWQNETAFHEIEIRNDAAGKPEIFLSGNTAAVAGRLNILKIFVSLSHLKAMATAIVILEI